MTFQDRKQLVSDRFDELKTTREEHLDKAANCLTEMTKLQGEYRLLEELEKSEQESKPNKKATTVEAVAEETE